MAFATHQHPEDELLFLAAQTTLLQGNPSTLPAAIAHVTDWKRFLRRAFETNLAPLAHACFRTHDTTGIPDHVLTGLRSYQRKIVAHNTLLYHALEQVVHLLNAAGIDFIPLKGMMLAEVVYGDIGLRQISDIDLLVRVRDVEACKDVLEEAGWSCRALVSMSANQGDEFFKHAHPYLFRKGDLSLELHQHVHNGWMDYTIDIDDYWKRATVSPFLKGQAYLLYPSDLLQHLCIHFYKHLNGAQIKISTLFDIPAVINHYQNRIDWVHLRETSQQYSCWKQVQSTLHLANAYCGVHAPQTLLKSFPKRFQIRNSQMFRQRIANPYFRETKGLAVLSLSAAKRKYIFLTIFPHKDYMINRYCPRYPSFFHLYYPIRFFRGLVLWLSFVRWKLLRKFN